MQGVLQLAQRIADGAPNDPNRFEDWLPFNATNWWIRPMDNGEWFCKVSSGPRIDTRVAVLAILMHWQQRIDADDMNSVVVRFDHKACVMKTYWVEEFPESPPEIHEHPDRATALAAYVESQIMAESDACKETQ